MELVTKKRLVKKPAGIIQVWKNKVPIFIPKSKLIDPIVREELDKVKHKVLTKDQDWQVIVDGEEGVGKSVLAQQIARYLDDDFNINNITFTSDDFIKAIKDPNTKKGSAIILDEAFSAANSRASMTEVNRSLIGVATEMRQKNLIIIIVLPSFFDLDRYFALWRCRALFHLYFDDHENRRYIIFPKRQKKNLYLHGKKGYNYSKPRSPYPPLVFDHVYTVDEDAYRLKKSLAFNRRVISQSAKKWMEQRNAYMKFIYERFKLTLEEIAKIPQKYGIPPVTNQTVSDIIVKNVDLGGDA